jgi:hypothetical protein
MRGIGTKLTKPALPNLKRLPYGGAEAVVSAHTRKTTQGMVSAASEYLYNDKIQNQFLERYRAWIGESYRNSFKNLDKFPVSASCNGTSEAFDKFYLDNCTRRFRCFRGEYMYHMASWRNYFDWAFIEDGELTAQDAVVISLPFSDTGNKHPDMQRVLNEAEQLGIPVLVDCAFFGICANIDFDFDHPAITVITFSLSKSYPVSHLRIGMRLTRVDDDDSLLVMNKTNYTNRLSAAVGLQILNHVSPDWNTQYWGAAQKELCDKLGVVPSNTVIFGIDSTDKYKAYNRGGVSNRLSLSKYLANKDLPSD